jgi:speckle-type POZ protein
MYVHQIDAGATTLDVGTPPPPGVKLRTFNILFHGFKDLPFERNQYVMSPSFTCNGHQWALRIYPGGFDGATDDHVSAYLYLLSEGTITCAYEVKTLDKFRRFGHFLKMKVRTHSSSGKNTRGVVNFMRRSVILDESMNIVDDNGTLAFIVSMKEESTSVHPFIPENDFNKKVQGMFLDEESADLCFEVSNVDEEKERIYAHRFILTTCAPMLASLFESSAIAKRTRSSRVSIGIGEVATASITDVKPEIFRHLLYYLYGGTVPAKSMKAHAKEIIDAADKYDIVNLKLEAEATYVRGTVITIDNVLDNLLYADAKNCALLKEAVMDFLAEHHNEAVKKVTFADVPGHLMKDLLVAFGRSKSEDKAEEKGDYDAMRVSELRSKLNEMGLDVDGSREAMIDTLKKSAKGK